MVRQYIVEMRNRASILQTLEQSEVERIVSAYAADGAKAVAQALIRAVEAVRDPHQDNATVVAVRVVPAAGSALS